MKQILVVVDYQNDFVNGSLGFSKAKLIEDAICNKIDAYLSNGYEVCFTLDTHHEDYSSTQEGEKLPIPHCIEGTKGHKLYGRVAKYADLTHRDKHGVHNSMNRWKVVGTSDSAVNIKLFQKGTFGSSELFEYLKNGEYESIELAGLVTNICVVANAVLAKTAKPEAEIIIDALCTASNDDRLFRSALDVLESMQVNVINRVGSNDNPFVNMTIDKNKDKSNDKSKKASDKITIKSSQNFDEASTKIRKNMNWRRMND